MIGYYKGNTLILSVLLLALWPAIGLSQQQPNQPLSENENPLLIGKRNINKNQINFYSVERQIALGNQLAEEFEKQSKLIDDAALTVYLKNLGRNLASHSDTKIPVTIKVVDSEAVNAFALPGGFLYLNLGLMRVVETESELAAVIGHLIAHVAAHHSVELASKVQNLNRARLRQGIFDESRDNGSNLAAPLAVIALQRKMAAEADMLGVQYAWASGYNPSSLIKFYEKSSQPEASSVARVFSTHPHTTERITKVNDLIARFPERAAYTVNTADFNRVKLGLPSEPLKNQKFRRK
jgi:beta-barrel assembly-enhancing protease